MYASLPAPYELNPHTPQALKRGGKARRPKMVLAHFNPKELHVLDHLQGHQECCPRSGLRSYEHLEALLKNPHLVNSVHHHVRQHHAEGGSTYGVPELEHLAHEGRYGDSEMALIGPHTHRLFNAMAGHATRNPHTGHPEYFSLGDLLGGLWNGIKGIGSKVLGGLGGIGKSLFSSAKPALSQAVSGLAQQGVQALGNRIGGSAGNFISNLAPHAGNLANQGVQALGQRAFGNAEESPMTQAIGQGMGQTFNAYQSGQNLGQSLGQGLNHAGRQFGGGGLGGAMQGAGQALTQGQGFGQAMRQGAQRGFQGAGGLQGLARAGQDVYGRYQQGGNLGQAMRSGLGRYADQQLPDNASMQRLRDFEELPFAQEA